MANDDSKQLKKLTDAIQALVNREVLPVAPVAPVLPVAPILPVQPSNPEDHNLILGLVGKVDTVNVKVDAIKIDIKELKDDNTNRINKLENEKLNKDESYPVLYKKLNDDSHLDFENRLRSNESRITKLWSYGTALIVLLGIVEFLISKFL